MPPIAIRVPRIFTGDTLAEGGVVLVRDARIEAVGLREPPSGAELIDLPGATLLPGLIDAHSHLSIVPGKGNQIDQLRQPLEAGLPVARENLLRSLRSGVTTMRVLGEEHGLDFLLQREIAAGDTPGPRLVCAGTPIAKVGGHGHALTAVRDEADIVWVAAENLARGAGVLKIFATGGISSSGTLADDAPFSVREIAAAAAVAHRHGVLLAAHAHGGEGARRAIDGGVDTIEHGAALEDDHIEDIVRKNLAVVATFSILYHPDGIERGDAGSPAIMRKLHDARETMARTWRHLVGARVRYAVGTDSMHGLVAFDVARLVDVGATPLEALRAATVRGAEVCGVADTRGRLAAGYDADLIAVDGDPAEDITALARPLFVMQRGHIVERGLNPSIGVCRAAYDVRPVWPKPPAEDDSGTSPTVSPQNDS